MECATDLHEFNAPPQHARLPHGSLGLVLGQQPVGDGHRQPPRHLSVHEVVLEALGHVGVDPGQDLGVLVAQLPDEVGQHLFEHPGEVLAEGRSRPLDGHQGVVDHAVNGVRVGQSFSCSFSFFFVTRHCAFFDETPDLQICELIAEICN